MSSIVQQTEPATLEGAPEAVEREFTVASRSQRQQIVRRFLHNRLAMGAAVVNVTVVAASFIIPTFYQWGYSDLDLEALSVRPGSPGHILSTADAGRDLLAMLCRAVQRSPLIAVVYILLAGVIGVLIGAVAGYFGRWVDSWLMRFVDLILTIPLLVVVAVVASNFPNL